MEQDQLNFNADEFLEGVAQTDRVLLYGALEQTYRTLSTQITYRGEHEGIQPIGMVEFTAKGYQFELAHIMEGGELDYVVIVKPAADSQVALAPFGQNLSELTIGMTESKIAARALDTNGQPLPVNFPDRYLARLAKIIIEDSPKPSNQKPLWTSGQKLDIDPRDR